MELEELLRNVNGSYWDFVVGIPLILKKIDGGEQKVIEFIKENPDARTSEIIRFVDKLEGI